MRKSKFRLITNFWLAIQLLIFKDAFFLLFNFFFISPLTVFLPICTVQYSARKTSWGTGFSITVHAAHIWRRLLGGGARAAIKMSPELF